MRWIISTLIAGAMTAAAVALAWIFVPWPAVLEAWSASRSLPLVAAVFLVPAIQWFRAWRFSILLTGTTKPPSGSVVRVTLLAVVLNTLLPFRIGELGFPLLMRRHEGIPLLRGAGILALVRLWDLALVCTLACALTLVVLPPVDRYERLALAVVGLLSMLLTLRLPSWGRRIVSAIRTATRHHRRLDAVAERLASGLQSLHATRSIVGALVAGAAIWLLHASIGILVFSAGPVPTDPALVALATLAGTLAFALPINGIAAIGPTHAAWTGVLTLGGVSLEHAVATGILWHALLVLTSFVLGSAAALWPSNSRGGGPC